jgi:hypothetical protein
MKKALIEAAYQAWYRDMKDCKIGHTDEAYRPDPKDPNPYTPEDYNHDSMGGSRTSNESESEDTHKTEKSGVNDSAEESTSREDNDDEYEKEQPE